MQKIWGGEGAGYAKYCCFYIFSNNCYIPGDLWDMVVYLCACKDANFSSLEGTIVKSNEIYDIFILFICLPNSEDANFKYFFKQVLLMHA